MTEPDHESTNWKRATMLTKRTTMLIWEASDAELAAIIHAAFTFEEQHAREMSPAELRALFPMPF